MALELARAWLQEHRNDDGSWGYVVGNPGAPEPSLLAAAALGGDSAIVAWLAAAELAWGALLLPACLSRSPLAGALVAESVAHIRETTALVPPGTYGFDAEIPAWSWYPETAAWVEPTAYAVLSLRRAGVGSDPRAVDGARMLLDRQCADGGWNYGNPAALGAALGGDLPPTAWAVMALAPSDAVERGLAYLRGALERRSSTTLALGALAFSAHGGDAGPFLEALVSRQAEDGSFGGRVDRTALAAVAIEAGQGAGCAFFDAQPTEARR